MDCRVCLAWATVLPVIAVVSVGCTDAGPRITSYTLLFDGSGRERADPTGDLGRTLVSEELSDAERRALVDEAVTVVEEGRGYSRFVAADALIWLTRTFPSESLVHSVIKVDGPSLVTQRMVDVMAHHCLRISRNSVDPEVADKYGPIVDQVPVSWIRGGLEEWDLYENRPPELGSLVHMPYDRWDYPVDATLEVQVDGRTLALTAMGGHGNALSGPSRTGWRVGRVQVWLDGQLVADKPRQPAPYGNETVRVTLAKTISADDLIGKHVYRCRVELVAPNELSTTVEDEYTIEILEHELSLRTDRAPARPGWACF